MSNGIIPPNSFDPKNIKPFSMDDFARQIMPIAKAPEVIPVAAINQEKLIALQQQAVKELEEIRKNTGNLSVLARRVGSDFEPTYPFC